MPELQAGADLFKQNLQRRRPDVRNSKAIKFAKAQKLFMTIKIAISAGEASGDEHASDLIRAIRSFKTDLEVKGMGGRNLYAAGVQMVVDSEKSASVMGFQELFSRARGLFSAWRSMKQLLQDWKPDILVLVDFPDFNLRLARMAKAQSIKVFYFITPKLWAWRSSRIKLFKRYIDCAAVIFPFERRFFQEHGYYNSVFVGHPFAKKIQRLADETVERAYCRNFLLSQGLDPHKPTLALFPGSRGFEIERHLPVLDRAVLTLQKKHPGLQALLAVAPAIQEKVRTCLNRCSADFTPLVGRPLDVLRAADAGLLKSGTSNLQAAFFGLPFAMFFKASLLAEAIVRTMVPLREFSIVNVLQSGSVKELIQREASPANLAYAAEELLFDEQKRENIQRALFQVTQMLCTFDQQPGFENCQDAYQRAAKLLLTTLAGK